MLGFKLVNWLVKEPLLLPFEVCASDTVGFTAVDQQIPDAVIAVPPFETIVPPEVAEFCEMLVTLAVVRVATGALDVVN